MDKPLRGRVALVTGGGRGIGRAICLKLASLGAQVAVNYSRSSEAAEGVVREIESLDGRALSIGFDVSDEAAVDDGVRRVVSELGSLEILVNNAGVTSDGLLVRTKAEDWRRTLEINLSGCFFCAKAVAKTMMKARSGRIISLSSVIGETGNAGQAAYAASKSGIFGLTKSLAKELGSRGITVNAVTPGFIKTDMTEHLSEAQKESLLAQIALGRLGEPEDVAEVVAFLALPAASYITGQVLGVNGGMHM